MPFSATFAAAEAALRRACKSVETILELLSSGMTEAKILDDYQDLEQKDIHAVLAYAVGQ